MSLIVNPRSELLREPNLLVPGKGPIGRVKIDWNNSATKGLSACVIATDTGLVDLVRNNIPSSDSSTIRYGLNGLSRAYDGTQVTELPTSARYGISQPFNMFMIFDVDALTNYSAIAGHINDGANGYVGWNLRLGGSSATASDPLFIRGGTSDNQVYRSSTGRYSAGTKDNYMAILSNSGNSSDPPTGGYGDISNMVFEVMSDVGGNNIGATGVSTDPIRFGSREDGVTHLDGSIRLFIMWQQNRGDNWVSQFSKDPYQFLIPA